MVRLKLNPENVQLYIKNGYIPTNKKYKLKHDSNLNSLGYLYDTYIDVINNIGDKYDNIAVQMSGGKDTRFIAGLLYKMDIPFTAICHSFPYSNDPEIGLRICRVLDAPLVVVPFGVQDMLWGDMVYEYSILGQKNVSLAPFDKYYQGFDIVLSGWGMTETAWYPFPKLNYLFDFLYKKMDIFIKKINLCPLVFDKKILSATYNCYRDRKKYNIIWKMLEIYINNDRLMKIPWSHTGLSLRYPFKLQNKLRKYINMYYHVLGLPNIHFPTDCSWYIRNCISQIDLLKIIFSVYNKYPFFDLRGQIDFINDFYKRKRNVKTRILPFIALHNIMENDGGVLPLGMK